MSSPVVPQEVFVGQDVLVPLPPFQGEQGAGSAEEIATSAASADRAERSRRLLNFALASVGLLVAAPMMLIIAAAIKLTSRGPVFYTQMRVGLDRRQGQPDPLANGRRHHDCGGKPFRIYKFRTMRVADGKSPQVWADPHDPRVTAVGRVLRGYGLDELPQLINVIKGDMNLVGPRPEQPAIFAELRSRVEGYEERQRVLPGLTGWAQINQQYDRSIEDVRRKVGYDLEYIGRRSMMEDLRILLLTLPVIALRRSGW